MTDRSFLVIANAGAGTATAERVRLAVGRLSEVGPTELHWSNSPASLASHLENLGGRTPVLVGGDGSIHAGINALADQHLLRGPVGYLPAGTGNDLARDLELPLDPLEAAEVVSYGRTVALPLLEVEGDDGVRRWAVNNLHCGLGPLVSERAADWKHALGRFAYPAATSQLGMSYEGIQIDVELDGRPFFKGRALVVALLLGRFVGGGVQVVEHAHVEGGLDVLVIAPESSAARLSVVKEVALGRLIEHDDVLRARGREVTLRSDDSIDIVIDGEVVDVGRHLVATLVADGWQAIVPDIEESERGA